MIDAEFERKEFKSPVYNVIAVPVEKVRANSYNPLLHKRRRCI